MLLRCPAAVDAEHGAGCVAGRVAREVNGRALNFLQIPPTLERGSAHDEFLALFRIRNGHVHRRKNGPGQIALTVMPSSAISVANERVSITVPPLLLQ